MNHFSHTQDLTVTPNITAAAAITKQRLRPIDFGGLGNVDLLLLTYHHPLTELSIINNHFYLTVTFTRYQYRTFK